MKNEKRKRFFLVVYCLSSVTRILSGPLIFFFPIPAIIISFFLDGIDGEFASKQVLTLDQYEQYDKALDLWWFSNAVLFSSYFFHATPWIRYTLIALFAYRLLGEIIFFFNNDRKILFIFPNFFENFFIFFFVATYFPVLMRQPTISVIFIVLVVTKILQEWWLHIAKQSVSEHLFKRKKQWKT